MSEPIIFIATPSHDGTVTLPWVAGCLQAMQHFAGRVMMESQCGSFLPRNRDILTARFLQSGCSHMLCVDSDIGWKPTDAQKLLDTGKMFVSGVYCKKQPDRAIPAEFTSKTDDNLAQCNYVPAGFLLLSRQVIVAMCDAYQHLRYDNPVGKLTALWSSLFERRQYDGEDVAFCRRWTAIGGEIWMHMGVVVKHIGTTVYLPQVTSGTG